MRALKTGPDDDDPMRATSPADPHPAGAPRPQGVPVPEAVPFPRRSSPPVPGSPRRSVRRVRPVVIALVATGLAVAGAATAASAVVRPVPAVRLSVALAGSADHPLPTPASPVNPSAKLEDPAPYVKQVSCDPVAKPGATALGTLLVATYPGTSFGVARPCGDDGIASEHYEGRAVDWMVRARDPEAVARAEAFLGWLLAPDAAGNGFANARRLGVMYVIWNDRIWGSYASADGWRAYSSCAAHPEPAWDTSCHRDHVHLSLSWAGAAGRTSFWTGKVAANDYGPCRPADLNWAAPRSGVNPSPCPPYPAVTAPPGSAATLAALVRYSGATIGQGSSGPAVRALQAGLGIAVDGRYGAGTVAAVAGLRRSQGLPDGNGMDAAAWRALLEVVAGAPTSAGSSAPSSPRTSPKPTSPKASELTRYSGQVLSYGSRGPAVTALQRALKVTPVSGWFGPVTRSAVSAFQTSKGLPATGVVAAATWRALGA